MARNHARLFASIWNDDDFLALPPRPQRMYMFLISQQDLQHCGVIALRERRWSRGAAGMTVEDVRADLDLLAERWFVVIDDETEELLVRSLMRRDKVYAQPNVFKAAADQIRALSSPVIKAVLLDELRRLPVAEIKGDSRRVHEELVGDLAKTTGDGTPSPTPSGRGNGTPYRPLSGASEETATPHGGSQDSTLGVSGNASSGEAVIAAGRKGSRRGSRTPSERVPSEPRGKGSSYGEKVVVPLPPRPLPVPPSAGAAAPERETAANAGDVVAAWIEGVQAATGERPASRLIGQIGRQARELLDEGKDPERLIEAATAAGRKRFADLPRELLRMSSTTSQDPSGGRFAPGSGSRAPLPTADDIANGQVIL
ncbi:hypothetical protein ACNF49_14025 [Actinomadura sp. ATCC 39365]